MKFRHLLSFFLSLSPLAFSACGSDSKPSTQTPPAPEAAAPASPKPEIYLYSAWVDKLNLRDQSNKNGKVLAQLALGDFVEGTGEVSANTEEATLRNIPFNEPYFKVSTTTPEQLNGWVYSAGLKPVYAGSRATSPDLGRLSQLNALLKTLKSTKLDNGKIAIDYVKNNFGNANGTLADAAFVLLEDFLFRMEIEGSFYTLTERVKWADTDYEAILNETFDMNKYPVTKSLAANGFRLEEGEGMIFPIVDWAKLAEFFSDKVTPPMKQYILEKVAEQKDNAFDDGGIVVGLDTIAERAAFWEKFNRQNPYFIRSVETSSSERWLRNTVLAGSDNTPAFNYDTQTLQDDFKQTWALILQKYPGTTLAKDVKELSDLLAAEGGKRTKKIEDWQSQYANKLQEK